MRITTPITASILWLCLTGTLKAEYTLEAQMRNQLVAARLYQGLAQITADLGAKVMQQWAARKPLPALAWYYRGLIACTRGQNSQARGYFMQCQKYSRCSWLRSVAAVWVAACDGDYRAVSTFCQQAHPRVRSACARVLAQYFGRSSLSMAMAAQQEGQPPDLTVLRKNVALVAPPGDARALAALQAIGYCQAQESLVLERLRVGKDQVVMRASLCDPALFTAWARYHLGRASLLLQQARAQPRCWSRQTMYCALDILMDQGQWSAAQRLLKQYPKWIQDPLVQLRAQYCAWQVQRTAWPAQPNLPAPGEQLQACLLYAEWNMRLDQALAQGRQALARLRRRTPEWAPYYFLRRYRSWIWPLGWLYLRKAQQLAGPRHASCLSKALAIFEALFTKSQRGNLHFFEPLFLIRMAQALCVAQHYRPLLQFVLTTRLLPLLQQPGRLPEGDTILILARASGQLRPLVKELLSVRCFVEQHQIAPARQEPTLPAGNLLEWLALETGAEQDRVAAAVTSLAKDQAFEDEAKSVRAPATVGNGSTAPAGALATVRSGTAPAAGVPITARSAVAPPAHTVLVVQPVSGGKTGKMPAVAGRRTDAVTVAAPDSNRGTIGYLWLWLGLALFGLGLGGYRVISVWRLRQEIKREVLED